MNDKDFIHSISTIDTSDHPSIQESNREIIISGTLFMKNCLIPGFSKCFNLKDEDFHIAKEGITIINKQAFTWKNFKL